MIIGTSAAIAVVREEPDANEFLRVIMQTTRREMSVANWLEAAIVAESRGGDQAARDLDVFREQARIELVPVTVEQVEAARRAWRRFGKGNHPAGLNFGDCFAYALADVTGQRLLFKGDDFAQTDIAPA